VTGGPVGCPGTRTGEKPGFFFGFFPTFLYSKKSSIKPLSTCINIYLIYVEGSPGCRGIFIVANGRVCRMRKVGSHGCSTSGGFLMPRNEPRRQGGPGGRVFPRLLHPEDFLMPQNEPRRQGGPGGRVFPRLLHPGAHPISWDAGVPPGIMPITSTGYPSILGNTR
jgi:hypothetical protein